MDSFSDASVNLSNFWGQYTHEATCMPRQHQDSLLDAARQGEEGHETAAKHSARGVLIVCLTLLIFTYLTRKSLCEIRYRDTNREVAAFMAYESAK